MRYKRKAAEMLGYQLKNRRKAIIFVLGSKVWSSVWFDWKRGMKYMEEFIKQYWNCIASQDEEELKKYFHRHACIRWHNTNEQFNVPEFLRANCDYPGNWNGEVERIEQIGYTHITVTHVWSNEISFHVTSFIVIKNGKIEVLDEYWGDDGVAPQWRQDKHIGRPIV
ncbi:nuclear transport factor 2 family protein [Sporolactobacillus shoreicorticis]|uniref:Nuclear transport factor 2 family protein n=1 Tax=Sporolactobacillus shoreicorticis TaxID=1923877 RepID=A0ABW5S906_9BACL|nr:nuclear transport factor 2 family protein [Sporolactobacillus shoreicorticis]MCO7125468.1 nuclear transport factor 2 family protein [Sporolactobacillus shoreicorticis]